MDASQYSIIPALVAIIFLLLWVYPIAIAFRRKHHARFAILFIDLFFGWTIIGWIICIVWAFGINTEDNYPVKKGN